MKKSVLFYSKRCDHCKVLLDTIKANEISDEFQLVEVESSMVPSDIKSVPTIVDTTMRFHVGIACFDLIKTMSQGDLSVYELGQSNETRFSYLGGSGEMERAMKYMYTEQEPPFQNLASGSDSTSQPGVDPRLQKLIDQRKNDSSIAPPLQRT